MGFYKLRIGFHLFIGLGIELNKEYIKIYLSFIYIFIGITKESKGYNILDIIIKEDNYE